MEKTGPYANLLDLEPGDVERPDYAILAFAVCAMEQDSCGWGGWIVEGVFQVTEQIHHTLNGHKSLSADTKQICPSCGKSTFRTFCYRFNFSKLS